MINFSLEEEIVLIYWFKALVLYNETSDSLRLNAYNKSFLILGIGHFRNISIINTFPFHSISILCVHIHEPTEHGFHYVNRCVVCFLPICSLKDVLSELLDIEIVNLLTQTGVNTSASAIKTIKCVLYSQYNWTFAIRKHVHLS